MQKKRFDTKSMVAALVCLVIGAVMLVVQFGIVAQMQKTVAKQQGTINDLHAEVDSLKDRMFHSTELLGRRNEQRDSLQEEIGRIKEFIRQSRKELVSRENALDSVEDNMAFFGTENKRREAVLDSLDRQIESVKQQLRDRFSDYGRLKNEVGRLQELLFRARKKITRLQTDHTIRTLFVYDNYLESDVGRNDETIHFSEKKGIVISLFDSCARVNKWHERYCDLPKIVYGTNAGARYIEIKNISQKYGFTYESLYFLARAEGYDPLDVKEWQLKEIAGRTFRRFDFEKKLAFGIASNQITSARFSNYCSQQAKRFKNGRAWP
ncbi:MAG: hypothetical protein GF350_02250 [Chitinivibrionales bacterium]|nr:hypothetical protein [Chitinivibrionales bacterium]